MKWWQARGEMLSIILTTFSILLLDDEEGGALMRPAGGGGSIPSPPPDLVLGLALSLLGMLIFTFIVCPSLNARSSCGWGSEFSYKEIIPSILETSLYFLITWSAELNFTIIVKLT